MLVVLGRIGTPRAIDAIEKVLEHDWRGAVGTNRQVAAQALVWLGARDRIPALEAAIADHERLLLRNSGQKLADARLPRALTGARNDALETVALYQP